MVMRRARPNRWGAAMGRGHSCDPVPHSRTYPRADGGTLTRRWSMNEPSTTVWKRGRQIHGVATTREAVGQRSETVRRANLSAILRELHLRGPLTRSQLVARTGLTRSAIRELVGEFVAAGLASEERAARLVSPGRP